MKIYNANNFFQSQRTAINQRITSKVIFKGDTGQNALKGMDKDLGSFSFETVELTRLNTNIQERLVRFETLSLEHQQQLFNDAPDLSKLTPESAQALLKEDGYYGVAKTSARIADFVLTGAGDDLDRLKQGRKGIALGFKEAEKAWGGTLPDISYQTIEKAIKAIDDRINELGGSLVSLSA